MTAELLGFLVVDEGRHGIATGGKVPFEFAMMVVSHLEHDFFAFFFVLLFFVLVSPLRRLAKNKGIFRRDEDRMPSTSTTALATLLRSRRSLIAIPTKCNARWVFSNSLFSFFSPVGGKLKGSRWTEDAWNNYNRIKVGGSGLGFLFH